MKMFYLIFDLLFFSVLFFTLDFLFFIVISFYILEVFFSLLLLFVFIFFMGGFSNFPMVLVVSSFNFFSSLLSNGCVSVLKASPSPSSEMTISYEDGVKVITGTPSKKPLSWKESGPKTAPFTHFKKFFIGVPEKFTISMSKPGESSFDYTIETMKSSDSVVKSFKSFSSGSFCFSSGFKEVTYISNLFNIFHFKYDCYNLNSIDFFIFSLGCLIHDSISEISKLQGKKPVDLEYFLSGFNSFVISKFKFNLVSGKLYFEGVVIPIDPCFWLDVLSDDGSFSKVFLFPGDGFVDLVEYHFIMSEGVVSKGLPVFDAEDVCMDVIGVYNLMVGDKKDLELFFECHNNLVKKFYGFGNIFDFVTYKSQFGKKDMYYEFLKNNGTFWN